MSAIPQHIDLSADQIALLGELTLKTGKSPQEVVTEALRRYEPVAEARVEVNESSESVYDSFAKAGLIGCIKGGPADLSTNPIYMEGFGKSHG